MRRLHQYAQHFLRNPRFVAELVAKAGIAADDVVYDLGAGSGTVTSALAARARTVVAVELEPQAATRLRLNMAGHANVTVVEADILAVPLPTEPYKVFANIPFHISSKVVRRLTEADNPPTDVYLIVQKQFAQKLVLSNNHFTGALAMMIAPWFVARIVQPLRRSDFSPQPAVDTVLLHIAHRKQPLLSSDHATAYRDLIAGCYHDPNIFAKTPRQKVGIDTSRKPSQLAVGEWVGLYHAMHR